MIKKILIVEDEPLVRKSLQKLLIKRGCEVDVSATGKGAIKKIHYNCYDRIICDLMLQDITGFDVIEESKKWFSLDQIHHKFVIITAYSSKQVLDKASSYGCKVLSKPFDNMGQALDILIAEDS